MSPYLGLLSTGMGLLVLVLFFPGGLARVVGVVRDYAATLITGRDSVGGAAGRRLGRLARDPAGIAMSREAKSHETVDS